MPSSKIEKFSLKDELFNLGKVEKIANEIEALEDVTLLVDYLVLFCTKSGKLSPKVHKLKNSELIVLKKQHPSRANMTTRKLYAGEHLLEIQINGKVVHKESFELRAPPLPLN